MLNETELRVMFATMDVANLITQTKALDTDPDPSPNRGAAKLREYWVHGKGATEIRWGEHGDFMRCVKHLGKYVTDPKGLCNVYHRAALGVAPGQEKVDEVDAEFKGRVYVGNGRTEERANDPKPKPKPAPKHKPKPKAKEKENNNSHFNGLHPRNADGTFAYKNDDGKGDAQKGDKDAAAKDDPDGKIHGRISEAQDALVKAGVLGKKDGRKGVAVDGYLGPKTEAALKKYQKKHGLKETGKIDTATSKKLGLTKSGSGKKDFDPDNIEVDSSTTDTKDGDMQVSYKTASVGGINVVDEGDGKVTAIVSVTGIKDNVNDIIEPGAYAATLAKRLPKGVWSHDWNKPISKTLGIKELMPLDPDLPKQLPNGDPWPEEAGALKVEMQFNMKTERGRTAYEDVVFYDAEQEWSIGYNVPAGQAVKKDGVRRIKSLDLFEYSPVLFGAMPNARTSSLHAVKDAQMMYKSLVAEREDIFENAEAYDEWFTELKSFMDEQGIETKSVKKTKDEEEEPEEDDTEDEDAEVEEDTDAEDNEEDVEGDDEDDEDEEEDEKKYVTKSGLSSVTAEKITAVIDALNDLLSSAAPRAESQEEKSVGVTDSVIEGPTTATVADAVESVGDALPSDDYNELMDAAEGFDTAFENGDEEALEAASEELLDMIEENLDEAEEKVAEGLQNIAGVIGDQLDKIGGGEGSDEEKGIRYVRSENGAERYGVPIGIRVDAKVFAEGAMEVKADTSGVHGVDWIWEGESWDDYRHLWDPKHPKYKKPAAAKKPAPKKAPAKRTTGTFQHGPRSANASNGSKPKGMRTSGNRTTFDTGAWRNSDTAAAMRALLTPGALVTTGSGRNVRVVEAPGKSAASVRVADSNGRGSKINLGSIVTIEKPGRGKKEDAPEVETKTITLDELAEMKAFALDVSTLLDS